MVTKDNKIIREDFPIKPQDIDAQRSLSPSFRYANMEMAAARIVRLCQKKQSWDPFTKAEIFRFLYEEGTEDESYWRFNEKEPTFLSVLTWIKDERLTPWIVESFGKYYVTEEFVRLCHRAAPRRN